MTIIHFRPLTHIRRVIRSVAYLLPLQHAELELLSPCTKYKLAGRSRTTCVASIMVDHSFYKLCVVECNTLHTVTSVECTS